MPGTARAQKEEAMSRSAVLVACICLTVLVAPSFGQEAPWLADRGPGIPTSLFGTYITKGEFLVYPFYEYTKNTGEEYNPAELGADWTEKGEYMGTLVEHEYLLFLAYGISEWFHIELEGALYAKGTFDTAPDDRVGPPGPDRGVGPRRRRVTAPLAVEQGDGEEAGVLQLLRGRVSAPA